MSWAAAAGNYAPSSRRGVIRAVRLFAGGFMDFSVLGMWK